MNAEKMLLKLALWLESRKKEYKEWNAGVDDYRRGKIHMAEEVTRMLKEYVEEETE